MTTQPHSLDKLVELYRAGQMPYAEFRKKSGLNNAQAWQAFQAHGYDGLLRP